MATAAQIAANRENAKSSTGPRTPEGKRTAASNSLTFGLFTVANCVNPPDEDEYRQLSTGLLDELRPVGNVETMLATEVVRCAWRLRRCATAERGLGLSGWEYLQKNFPEKASAGWTPADPIAAENTAAAQCAIDRARSGAQNGLRRALAELEHRQTERFLRTELCPAEIDPPSLGLARVKEIVLAQDSNAKRKAAAIVARRKQAHDAMLRHLHQDDAMMARVLAETRLARTPPDAGPKSDPPNPDIETAKRTQSPGGAPAPQTPRNAPCPCGSGNKYKRCCGPSAAPALSMTA